MQKSEEINWNVPELKLSVRELFSGPTARLYWTVAILGLLAEIGIIYSVINSGLNSEISAKGLAVIFTLPALGIGLLKYIIGEKKRQYFFKTFSALNGFIYQPNSLTGIPDSSLFTVGHSKTKNHEIAGNIGRIKFKIFIYRYTIGSGKSAHTYTASVMELSLPAQAGSMMLIPNRMSFGDELADNKLKNVSAVPLPSEFLTSYRLFCENKMEPEALHIFSPEILILLKNQFPNVTLEFMANQLFIYSRTVADTTNTLKPFFVLMDFTQQALLPRLLAQEGSVKAMQEVLTKAPAQGVLSKQWIVMKPEFKQGLIFALFLIIFLIITIVAVKQFTV